MKFASGEAMTNGSRGFWYIQGAKTVGVQVPIKWNPPKRLNFEGAGSLSETVISFPEFSDLYILE